MASLARHQPSRAAAGPLRPQRWAFPPARQNLERRSLRAASGGALVCGSERCWVHTSSARPLLLRRVQAVRSGEGFHLLAKTGRGDPCARLRGPFPCERGCGVGAERAVRRVIAPRGRPAGVRHATARTLCRERSRRAARGVQVATSRHRSSRAAAAVAKDKMVAARMQEAGEDGSDDDDSVTFVSVRNGDGDCKRPRERSTVRVACA